MKKRQNPGFRPAWVPIAEHEALKAEAARRGTSIQRLLGAIVREHLSPPQQPRAE